MIIGIVQIIIGGIVLGMSLFTNTNGSIQQTVKALWILTGVILICFGIVSILLSKIKDDISNSSNSKENFYETNMLLKNIINSISNLEINNKSIESSQIEITSTNEKQDKNIDTRFDNCKFIHRNGRVFALLDDNLYCTKCHAFIDSDLKTMCPNCGTSLME
ncbi:MAG: hypothetical protein J6Y30_07790 [Treponema sp.]|nr:hypothetical protein [Treponema sp.]